MENNNNIIFKVEDLKKYFPIRKGVFKRIVGHVRAVDGVSFFLRKGETLGLVGESGCGKTTLGRTVLRLYEPTSGSIKYFPGDGDDAIDISQLGKDEIGRIRLDIQMIFQDPNSSLDPRQTVRDIIAEPLEIHDIGNREEQTERVKELLEEVGLGSYQLNRYPHQFSGGQRQRIGLARALSVKPRMIVCDEPVSALDVSVQAQVLNLLEELQRKKGYTYLFIAHDLSVVDHISDRIMVMYLGRIVEMAASDAIYRQPKHPYTEALISAIPSRDPDYVKEDRVLLTGDVPSPSNPPNGCYFHPRCKYSKDICRKEYPNFRALEDDTDHWVACHRSDEIELQGYKEYLKKVT